MLVISLYSYEFTLLCVQNGIFRAVDESFRVVIVLLHLSTTFATIHRTIIQNQLMNLYGIETLAYLSECLHLRCCLSIQVWNYASSLAHDVR